MIQAVVLRDQSHSNGAPDPTVDNRHLEGGEQDTVSTAGNRHQKGLRLKEPGDRGVKEKGHPEGELRKVGPTLPQLLRK